MKLMTKTLAAKLPKLYSTENVKAEDKIAVMKFFDPCGRYTFYVVEGEPDPEYGYQFFGYCVSALGSDCDEWGYQVLSELEKVRSRCGLGIERDLHWTPKKMSEVLKGR